MFPSSKMVERSPRVQSVVGSNPTQGSSFVLGAVDFRLLCLCFASYLWLLSHVHNTERLA